jgi:hypothetical protein
MVSPAGGRFVRDYDHDIAFLTRCIQDLKRQLDALQAVEA